MPARDPELQALLDKQAIHELLVRYTRGIDRADVDLLRSCYHEDATEDHAGVFVGRAMDYIAHIEHALPRARVMTHAVSNVLIELDGDLAWAEAYVTTYARMKKGEQRFDTMTLARTFDRVERRDGVWRIAARRMSLEWNHDLEITEGWGHGLIVPPGVTPVRGAKKPDDMIYQREQ